MTCALQAAREGGVRWYDCRPMRRALRHLSVPVIAGFLLFVVNNFLLTRLVTRLPGGTAVAVTDMAVVALIVLRTRRFGSVVLIYATYGLLGFLGHLGIDGQAYLLRLPRLLVAALLFDVVVALGKYRWRGLAAGLLPFVLYVLFLLRSSHDAMTVLGALALGYAGLAVGAAIHFFLPGSSAHPRQDSVPPSDVTV